MKIEGAKRELILLWGLVASFGCRGSNQSNPADGAVADRATPDTPVDMAKLDLPQMDVPQTDILQRDVPADLPSPDIPAGDTQRDQIGGDAGPYGFPITPPGTKTVTCPGPPFMPMPTPREVSDVRWVCTFRYQATTAHVYLEATVVSCEDRFGDTPLFTVTRALISENGMLSNLANPAYEIGGHLNDKISFGWDGKRFEYFHSSLGFGARKCQPMDCLNVLTGGGMLIEQGCAPSRTLPQVCVPVGGDGVVPPLIDTFKKCPGDVN